jgi:SAM-dependent methyltransferase
VDQHLDQNKRAYESIYENQRTFLRYPADWIIRFHNMYMRKNIPSGRVLDYGCGSGNNLKFFLDKGYECHGTEVTEASLPLIEQNVGHTRNITITAPDVDRLPYPDKHFDFIVSNQVLYFLADRARIVSISKELHRVLKPGGAIFLTMMGGRNYYITTGYAKPIGANLYELKIGGDHRLSGFHQIFYIVPDEADLLGLFSMFEPLTTGYFDQAMFDMKSNFHWIFVGTRK